MLGGTTMRWAERRRLEQHPHTGAAQLVEIREVVREIEVRRYVAVDRTVFAGVPDGDQLPAGPSGAGRTCGPVRL